MLIGVSFDLKDKRVDKMLASKNLGQAGIFYSPISSWIILLLLVLPSGAWLLLYLFSWTYWYLIVPYGIISYLLNAFFNNSFALHEDRLFVVNPNFPFRRFETIKRNEVSKMTIDKIKGQWLLVFAAYAGNYLSVQTTGKTMRFHCASLDQDAFDENWTEKTIESLHFALEKNGFPVTYNLKD